MKRPLLHPAIMDGTYVVFWAVRNTAVSQLVILTTLYLIVDGRIDGSSQSEISGKGMSAKALAFIRKVCMHLLRPYPEEALR